MTMLVAGGAVLGGLAVRAARVRSASPANPPSVVRPGVSLRFSGQILDGIEPEEAWPFGAPPSDAQAVVALLTGWEPDLGRQVDGLLRRGETFATHLRPETGAWWSVTGRLEGLGARIDLAPAEPGVAAMLDEVGGMRDRLGVAEAEGARANACPVPLYEVSAEGDILWSNRAARTFLEIGRKGGGLRGLPPRAAAERAALTTSTGQNLAWVRAEETQLTNGNRLMSVTAIDAEVRAEETLKSFVATMTETFANLHMALLVFDGERRLSLFNPAVTSIFGIPPQNLAMRPGLREFLDLLRSRRMVPEERNFILWRKALVDRLAAIGEAPFVEDWTLNDGQVLRVRASPHTGDAVALVVEDITGAVQIEQKYVAEIELGQSILDQVADGVAIVGLSGDVIFVNRAFHRLWPEAAELEGAGLDSLARVLGGGAVCDTIRAFALGNRAEGQVLVDCPRPGGTIPVCLTALPDGATLLQARATTGVWPNSEGERKLVAVHDAPARAMGER